MVNQLKKTALRPLVNPGDVKPGAAPTSPSSTTNAPAKVSPGGQARPTKDEYEAVSALQKKLEDFSEWLKPRSQGRNYRFDKLVNTGSGTDPHDGKWGPKLIDAIETAERIKKDLLKETLEPEKQLRPGVNYKQSKPEDVIALANKNVEILNNAMGIESSEETSKEVLDKNVPVVLTEETVLNNDGLQQITEDVLKDLPSFINYVNTIKFRTAETNKLYLDKVAKIVSSSNIIRLSQEVIVDPWAEKSPLEEGIESVKITVSDITEILKKLSRRAVEQLSEATFRKDEVLANIKRKYVKMLSDLQDQWEEVVASRKLQADKPVEELVQKETPKSQESGKADVSASIQVPKVSDEVGDGEQLFQKVMLFNPKNKSMLDVYRIAKYVGSPHVEQYSPVTLFKKNLTGYNVTTNALTFYSDTKGFNGSSLGKYKILLLNVQKLLVKANQKYMEYIRQVKINDRSLDPSLIDDLMAFQSSELQNWINLINQEVKAVERAIRSEARG